MDIKGCYIRCVVTILLASPIGLNAQVTAGDIERLNEKIETQSQEIQRLKTQLDSDTSELKQKVNHYAPLALVLFLFGGFCGLWAQNTGRNTIMWFFTGLLFSFFAVIVVLLRNGEVNRR